MREYSTGATRNDEEGKLDFEGFLSHDVLIAFGEYMDGHRQQADGKLRDSDNWQKGIPKDDYMKSAFRHFFAWWKQHRTGDDRDYMIESCCALMFNVQGYLHETLKVEKTSLQKIRDGLELAELPIEVPGAERQTLSWAESRARRHCGDDFETKGIDASYVLTDPLAKAISLIESMGLTARQVRDLRAQARGESDGDCGDSEPVNHDHGIFDEARLYEVDPNEADTTKNGCYETPELVTMPEWSCCCSSCEWTGSITSMTLDQVNGSCLCPDCAAPLLGLEVRVELDDEDDQNLYNKINQTVRLGIKYGAGLVKLQQLVETLYVKHMNQRIEK